MEQQTGLITKREETNLIIGSDRILLTLVIFIVFLFIVILDKSRYYGGFEYIPIEGFTSVFINSIAIILLSLFYLAINWKKERNLILLLVLGNLFLLGSIFLPFGSAFIRIPNRLIFNAFSIPLVLVLLLGEIIFGLISSLNLIKSSYREDYNISSVLAAISFLFGLHAFILIHLNLVFLPEMKYEIGFYFMALGTITMFMVFNSINGDNYPSNHPADSSS